MGKKSKKVQEVVEEPEVFEDEEEFDEEEFDEEDLAELEEEELDEGEEGDEDEEEEGDEDEEDQEADEEGDSYEYDDDAEGEEVMEEVEVEKMDPAEERAMMLNTQEVLGGTDLHMMKVKIYELQKILGDFKTMREDGKPRFEYVEELNELFCKYFGYSNDVMTIFSSLFSPHETLQFLEANEEQRPLTIRANTLKTKRKDLAQALIQRGVNLEPVGDWSKVGIKVNDSKVPIGATVEYLCGHYMLQSAASFLPVLAQAPHPGDKVLDLACAPGGKTTYIAQMMKNKGVLVANDYKKDRQRATYFNLQRMGINNTVVVNYDGRNFPKVMKGFDRVMQDAPCSCLGVIARYPAAKSSRQYMDVYKAAHLQRELLRAAIDCCKVGGYVVYSTCSVAVEENEAVVDYILKNRHVKIVDTGLPDDIDTKGYTKYMDKRFNDKLALTRRVYPHVQNLDGFYIAKLKKTKDGVKKEFEETPEVTATTSTAKPVAKKDKKDGKRKERHPKKEGKDKKEDATAKREPEEKTTEVPQKKLKKEEVSKPKKDETPAMSKEERAKRIALLKTKLAKKAK